MAEPIGKPICIVSGVGPGTGAALSRRFAEGGYRVAMLARNGERLANLEKEIPRTSSYVCDVSDEAAVNSTVAAIKKELGPPAVLIHNAVSGSFGTFLEIDPTDLELRAQDIDMLDHYRLERFREERDPWSTFA